MNPILYIIFAGRHRLDDLSVRDYRNIINSDMIWAWSLESALVTDIIGEGLSVQKLPNDTKESLYNLESVYTHLSGSPDFKKGCLIFAGNCLNDYGKVMDLIKHLATKADVIYLGQDSPMSNLINIMSKLRSEQGCPWDKEQNHVTLKKYLIEEAYEVLDAIDSKNMNNLCEELGDLLLQVVFHARIAEEAGTFTMNEVIGGISEKLIRRHPHVFGSIMAETSQEVILNWEAIKQTEKSAPQSNAKTVNEDFFKLPRGLPALMMAEAAQKKAGKVGFDWDAAEGPLAKIHEELRELELEIPNGQRQKEELGDLLFSIVNLSRFLDIDAEDALRSGVQKFQKRFNAMAELIAVNGLAIEDISLKDMDIYWEKAKKEEKNGTLVSF